MSPPETRLRHTTTILGLCFYVCGIATVFFAGGAVYLIFGDAPPPPQNVPPLDIAVVVAVITVTVGTLASGWLLARRVGRKHFLFGVLALTMLLPFTLIAAELVTRLFVPGWPAIGLHGVSGADTSQAWQPMRGAARSIGTNDWGQRDRPRSLKPPRGTRRIAFLGDSFLEEGSTIPVSLRVEQKLARNDLEVINLGVSASGPDEYFYRLRNVALPLGINHCVMFVFAGNDFVVPEPSLWSAWGIAAVYPRGSFLSSIGCRGLNHLLMNRFRPLIQAWHGAGELRQQEEHRRLVLQESDEETLRHLLLDSINLDSAARVRLWNRLKGPEIRPFLQILKAPDAGQFRSYYLAEALWSAAHGQTQWDRNNEAVAMEWIRRSANLCATHHIGFTLVMIPEAFQVDSRMVEQWRPLTDMRHLTRPCRDAAERLRTQARTEGIAVVDLHDILQDVPGTYLNLDGHWSDQGVELVSDTLVEWLKNLESSAASD